jgi:hypothetical protein
VRSCSARRGLATSLGLQAYPVRGVVSLIEGSMRPCSLATLRLSRSVSCSSTPRTSGVGTPCRSNSAGECRLPGERKAAAVPCSVGWRSKPPSDVNELRANPRRSSSTLGWTRPGTTRLYPRDSGPDKGSPASRLARRCAPGRPVPALVGGALGCLSLVGLDRQPSSVAPARRPLRMEPQNRRGPPQCSARRVPGPRVQARDIGNFLSPPKFYLQPSLRWRHLPGPGAFRMHSLIYLIGFIVVILAVLSLFGLR